MRLLTVDARRLGRDDAALARLIADAQPDVACIHGAPHRLRWRSKCAAIARQAGLVVVTGGRTAGANLIVSSLGVDVVAVEDVRFGRAGAALAALSQRGAEFLIACTNAPAAEVAAALRALVPGDRPAIVCADARADVAGSLTAGPATELPGGVGRVVEVRLSPTVAP
jgi:hypothetical protein